MSTLNSLGLEAIGMLGAAVVGSAAVLFVWCALRMEAELERAEALGLVRRHH